MTAMACSLAKATSSISMQNRRHPLDLSSAMAVCDGNYIRLLKLLPGFHLGLRREFSLPPIGPEAGLEHVVALTVEERFRYTSSVSLKVQLSGSGSAFYQPPLLLVRLYHDASTAEVVSYQQQGAFHVRPLPGEGPEFSLDEKQQVNALLAEWLTLCLEQGLGRRQVSAQDPDAGSLVTPVQ
jgi:uncharacterized protein YqiB (DUF1249 family)